MTSDDVDIADYALIGDSRTAALISRFGSIDWLCIPRFDSPSIFNRLLDSTHGGEFSIAPLGPFSSKRWYRDCSAVLVTEFLTEHGRFRVTDAMPVIAPAERASRLFPLCTLLRVIQGIEGKVPIRITFRPRPQHGRVIPRFRRRGRAGYVADLGGRLIHLATERELDVKAGEVSGQLRIGAEETIALWMAYSEDAPAVYPPLQEAANALFQTTEYWKQWAEQCTYDGPYRNEVMRSAITLKLLAFAPSGAIVAAPTTSLPEVIGGIRNWDYRYCWLRDASLTAQLFFRLGYRLEAEAFVQWLMHATALTYPRLQVLYDVHGEASLSERCLKNLRGYRNSAPVRIGNRAHDQYQLDVYGEVIDALLLFIEAGNQLDADMRRRLVKMAEVVVMEWQQADHGMWEIPTPRKQYVHSKVMCWVALDRAERLVRQLGIHTDVERWATTRQCIRETVLGHGYSTELRTFLQTVDGTATDALSLVFSVLGFLPGDDPRMLSTIEQVRKTLGAGEDLLYRYRSDDGLPGQEGAFLACSFWLVEALLLAGRREAAQGLFERLQDRANDVGLYSEEMDPVSGSMLGNFPQALTHLAHISAALRLDQRR